MSKNVIISIASHSELLYAAEGESILEVDTASHSELLYTAEGENILYFTIEMIR